MSNQTDSNFKQEYEDGRNRAVGMASFVYAGGVLAATVIFLSFILTAFPESAFLIRALMVLSCLLVGASGLAFPVAIHNWAVTRTHGLIAKGFYYGEIAILFLNTIVSFSALLFKFAGNGLPAWVAWYEPFTIASLGYVILAWGTIFITDPRAKSKARRIEVLERFDKEVAEGMGNYLNSQDGKLAVQAAANQRISESFSVKDQSPQPWIQNNAVFAPWACNFCGTGNIGSAQFCSQCGGPKSAVAPTQAPPAPALPVSVPRLPVLRPRSAPRPSFTLDDLLASMGATRPQALELVTKYQLSDARSAFQALEDAGYLPQGLDADSFMPLYCELLGVAPTWGAVALAPVSGSGRNF